MSNIKYDQDFKDNIVRLFLEGRTLSSLSKEYNVPEGTMRGWIKKYREECENNPTMQSEADQAAEIKRLKKELAEAKKENDFLKKAAAFFAKELD